MHGVTTVTTFNGNKDRIRYPSIELGEAYSGWIPLEAFFPDSDLMWVGGEHLDAVIHFFVDFVSSCLKRKAYRLETETFYGLNLE
ncbi:hypothetical protein PHET_02770 [Paragonimus heterotremus]|uniref:Uncharacterized protein n=1 Tax=Paragonimus heterotremus TaxID=100268 RepID=A0A8J4SRX7_9TREM|nr:hypothetical protein PHET_02770 [Paragonimus heterotremus]